MAMKQDFITSFLTDKSIVMKDEIGRDIKKANKEYLFFLQLT